MSQVGKNELTEKDAFDKGNALYRSGKFKEAIEHFQVAAKSGNASAAKNLSLAYNKIGIQYLNNSQNKEAVEAFKNAVQADNRSFDANNNLGLAYKAGGNLEEAIKFFEAVPMIAGNQHYFNTLYNLAECYKERGQYTKAIEAFQRCLKYKEEVSNILTVYSKIIESALLAKDPGALNQSAKSAFVFIKELQDKDYQANTSQLNYIMVHSGRIFLNNADTTKLLDSVAKLYAKVNPTKTLYNALIDYIYFEYNTDEGAPKEKIIKAENLLGRLLKNIKDSGAVAAVKEAAKLIAQQDDTSKGLVDKIVLVEAEKEDAATTLGKILESCGQMG